MTIDIHTIYGNRRRAAAPLATWGTKRVSRSAMKNGFGNDGNDLFWWTG